MSPIGKMVVTFLYIISTMLLGLKQSIFILMFTVIIAIVGARKIELFYLMRFLLIIAILSSLFVGLFYNWIRTLTVFFRISIIGLWTSIYIVTTNPDELSKFMEKIGLSPKISLILPLSLKFIPTVAKDAEETLTSLYFRGELIGSRMNPRNYIKPLTLLLASSLWRVKFIAESLACRGVLKGRKTFYLKKEIFGKKDIIFLAISIGYLIIVAYLPIVDPIFKIFNN